MIARLERSRKWAFFADSDPTPPALSNPTRNDWQPSPELWHKLKPLARQMRKDPTAAEAKLWQRLRKNQIRGIKFRRQFAIERFITDFCAPSIRLIIEVDGPTHEYTQAEDAIRQVYLESAGFTVLRFTNLDVLNTLDGSRV
jgi:very-short-patch-repair endonuclease